MMQAALKLLVNKATANCLCQYNAVQNVPNKILGKVTNFGAFGFPTVYYTTRVLQQKNVSRGGGWFSLRPSPTAPVWIGLRAS